MNKQVQTQIKNHLLRQAIVRNQKMDDKIRDLVANNGKIQDEPSADTENLILVPHLPQVPGQLIHTEILVAPFDDGTLLALNNASAPERVGNTYAIVTEAQKDTGELNFAAVMGKWFDVDYSIIDGNPPYPGTAVINSVCCYLSKTVKIDPYSHDIFVRATTVSILPDDPNMVYFLYRGNIQTAGVQGTLATSLSYKENAMDVHGASSNNIFLNAVQSAQAGDSSYYSPIKLTTCQVKLPAGTTEFVYLVNTNCKAFMSEDIIQQAAAGNSDASIALLDFRNQSRHRDFSIFRDPLISQDKEPFGGMTFMVKLEYFTAIDIIHAGTQVFTNPNI